MEAAPEPSARVPGADILAIAGVVGAATLGAMFAGGASGAGGILRVGGPAVVLLAASLVLCGLGRLSLPRLSSWGLVLVAATVLLVAWTGATVIWSIVPDRSWDAFNKGVAFAAFLGLGIVLAGVGGRWAERVAASVLAAGIGSVLVWALLAKTIPALDSGGDRVARLRVPVGYWNALALLADVGLGLAVWLGATRGHGIRVRVAGGLLGYAAVLALLLTLSRAGLVAAVVVVALWLALSRERVEGGLFLAAAVIPAAIVGGWAFTRPALVESGATHADRVSDGAIFGVFAVLGAVVAGMVVSFGAQRRLEDGPRRTLGRRLVAGVALGVLGALLALVIAVGNPVSKAWDEVSGSSCSEVANNPGRIGSLDLNNRWCWWTEAWHVFVAKVPLGAGADSFEVARKRYRVNAGSVVEPHSVPMQQLSDGGIVGLLLFLAFVVAGGAVCACAVRRLEGAERAAAVALLCAPAAYLVHALVDYDWDFLAVTAPTMLALGVLAGAGRPVVELARRPLLVASSVLVALAVLTSFSFPRLAERSNRGAIRALDERDYGAARDKADRARFFDPLAVDPLFTLAGIAARQGRDREALHRYVQAVELQPENPDTWFALGLFEFQVVRNMCDAYRFLNNAYTLDSAGTEWVKGGALDQARDAVNAGACTS